MSYYSIGATSLDSKSIREMAKKYADPNRPSVVVQASDGSWKGSPFASMAEAMNAYGDDTLTTPLPKYAAVFDPHNESGLKSWPEADTEYGTGILTLPVTVHATVTSKPHNGLGWLIGGGVLLGSIALATASKKGH